MPTGWVNFCCSRLSLRQHGLMKLIIRLPAEWHRDLDVPLDAASKIRPEGASALMKSTPSATGMQRPSLMCRSKVLLLEGGLLILPCPALPCPARLGGGGGGA